MLAAPCGSKSTCPQLLQYATTFGGTAPVLRHNTGRNAANLHSGLMLSGGFKSILDNLCHPNLKDLVLSSGLGIYESASACGMTTTTLIDAFGGPGVRTKYRGWIHIGADMVEADQAHEKRKCESKRHCKESAGEAASKLPALKHPIDWQLYFPYMLLRFRDVCIVT